MNPLEKLIVIALLNKYIIDNNPNYITTKENIISIPNNIEVDNFYKQENIIFYDTKEMAGIAGLYLTLKKEDYKIVYSNEMGLSIRGIDCIAIKNNIWYICEAKGTTTNKNTVSSFLRNTKTKGRQMSWNWIWRSLVEFAEDPFNSKVFLNLYQNIIYKKNVKRLVGVSYLERVDNMFSIKNTNLYYEKEINKLKGMNLFTNKKNLQEWLNSLNIKSVEDAVKLIIENKLGHNV